MASQLCTLDFTGSLQNCYQAKIQIKFCGFLHSRPIFYTVRLYVMTKMNGRCLKEWSLALFAVMSQNFILNLVNFDVEVYVDIQYKHYGY